MLSQTPPSARCLVVDDEPEIVDAYRTALTAPAWDEAGQTCGRRLALRAELFGAPKPLPDVLGALAVGGCYQGHEAIEMVRRALSDQQPYAVIFLDIRMPPGIDGIETARQIRSLDPDVNIVLVTGFADYGPGRINAAIPPVQNLLFFHKPVRADELKQLALALSAKWLAEQSLQALTQELEDRVAERTKELAIANTALRDEVALHRRTRDRLVHQARHDHLTGLLNRFALHEHITALLLPNKTTGNRYACFLLDMDNFKRINDTRGHAIGDTLLQLIAARLQGAVSDEVILARLGGDEFAVFAPISDGNAHESLARCLLEAMWAPFRIDGSALHIATSIGISFFPDHGANADTLFRCADLAMYEAKRRGGHCFVPYTLKLGDDADRTMRLEIALRRPNVIEEEFRLVGQPIVDRHGRISAVELLARWRSAGLGEVSPGEFIPLAEDRDLILPIGAWVLESSFRLAAEWGRTIPDPPCLFANLTMKELLDERLPDRIATLLERYGVHPGAIGLEVSERGILTGNAGARACLDRLKALGVVLAIDDFGAGCSGLGYLIDNPFDVLKIDQSIVRAWSLGQGNRDFLQSLVVLGASLKMRVAAEGIESAADWDCLIACGCDCFQGFQIARPAPLDEVVRLIRTGLPVAIDQGPPRPRPG